MTRGRFIIKRIFIEHGKLVMLCSLVCILIIFLAFFTTAENKNTIFRISEDYYSDDCDIFEYNSDVLIANYTDNPYISLLKTDSGTISLISEIPTDNMIGADVENNILAVACKTEEQERTYLKIDLYDLGSDFEQIKSYLLNFSDTCINCLRLIETDKKEAIILSKDRSSVYFFNLDDLGEPIKHTLGSSVEKLEKTENSQLYAQNSEENTLFLLSDTACYSCVHSDISFPVSFIDETTAISNDGKIHTINKDSHTLIYAFDTANKNDVAYKQGDDIFSFCKDCLLILDSKTHKEKGQIYLQYAPNKIIYCDDSFLCFSECENELIAEKAYNIAQQTEYLLYDTQSNMFITEPCDDIQQNIEPTVNNFKIIFDEESLIGGLRGNIEVSVSYAGQSQTLTTENGIEFVEPNEINFSIENLYNIGKYDVCVSGLCSNNGKPVKLSYSFSVVAKEESSQPSSSEASSSSTSSDIPSSQDASSKEPSSDIKSDKYHIDYTRKYILDIKSGTTVSQLKSNLICEDEMEVYNKSGKTVKSGNVGTGFSVKAKNSDDTFLLIVYGDVTGEGNINTRDINSVINRGLGAVDFEDCFEEAADFNRNGIFDDMDIVLIGEYVNN